MAERYGIWIPPCAMLKVVYRKAMNAWLVHSFMLKNVPVMLPKCLIGKTHKTNAQLTKEKNKE